MINDRYNYFSRAQAKTTTDSYASDNIVDLGVAGDALVRPTRFHTLITTAVTSAGAPAVTFSLQTATDAAFTSPVTLWTSAALAKATLVAGYHATPQAGVLVASGVLQYLRAYVTIATADLTAGAWDQWLTNDADTNNFTA